MKINTPKNQNSLYLCENKTINTMNTTAKRTAKIGKTTKLSGAVKRKLTTAEKDKLIKELSDSANRNMSFKLMVRLMSNRNR